MSIEAIQARALSQAPSGSSAAAPAEIPRQPVSQPDASAGRRYDEFVRSEAPKGVGLYQPVRNDGGGRSIAFDAPRAKQSAGAAEGTDEAESPEECRTARCTADTDSVDKEIRQLKQEKRRLEQAANAAQTPEKRAAQERQLAAIEAELSLKDNDAYRKQHTTYTFG